MKTNFGLYALSIAFVGLLAGCTIGASDDAMSAKSEIGEARGAIKLADKESTQATKPGALYEAQQKLRQANELYQNQDYAEAARMAEKATVDAELALELADSAEAQETATELLRGVDTLRQELGDRTRERYRAN